MGENKKNCLELPATWVCQKQVSDVNIDEHLELNRQVINACQCFRELGSEEEQEGSSLFCWIQAQFEETGKLTLFQYHFLSDLEFHVIVSSSQPVRVLCIKIVFSC